MGGTGPIGGRRVAVVGCGGAGRMHLDALARAGVVPSALVDTDPLRLAELGRTWPDAVLGPSIAAVAGRFDVAIVAVPDVHHAAVAVECLRAGADVLLEKPMAGTRADAALLLQAADEAGRLLAVAHVRRHLSVKRWALDLLRSGRLGEVQRVDAAQGGSDDWTAASGDYVDQAVGGVVADQGAHAIDLLSWWFGPLEVRSCTHDGRGGHEADATIELLAGRVPVHLALSRVRAMRNTVRVHTERGLLEVALDHYQPQQVVAVPEGVAVAPFAADPDDLADQFDRQLAAFSAALDGRWPTTLATGAEGAQVAGVIEDCYARAVHPPAAPLARPEGDGGVPLVGVLGATGAIGGRFVELVAADGRAPVRAIVHRWRHTARVVRFPVELRSSAPPGPASAADGFAAALDGCGVAVSFVDGPEADGALAEALVAGCTRAGIGRLVHLGCLGSFGAQASGRLDEDVAPAPPPGADAGRRWAFEEGLLAAGRAAGLEVVVVTAPLVCGPFARQGTVEPLRQVERGRVAVAAGSGRCHVISLDDVVEAVWSAVVAPGAVAGRIFATGPEATTWAGFFGAFERIADRPGVAVLPDAELAELVAAAALGGPEPRWPAVPGTGRRLVAAVARRAAPGREPPPRRRRLVLPTAEELAARRQDVEVPIERAARVLGWRPVVPLDEGMRRAADYLRWADPR